MTPSGPDAPGAGQNARRRLSGVGAERVGRGGRNMADQIPLYPVRGAAAAANRRRAAYYSAAGPGPGAERPSR